MNLNFCGLPIFSRTLTFPNPRPTHTQTLGTSILLTNTAKRCDVLPLNFRDVPTFLRIVFDSLQFICVQIRQLISARWDYMITPRPSQS